MLPQDAMSAAQEILERRAGAQFTVLVDNPNDCKATITAFRKLGCKVKVEQDGQRLVIVRKSE